MSVKIFLSTVSDEFRRYRDLLRTDLTRPNVEVKVQEDFKDLGSETLDKLDVYIAHCDAVVHLVGDLSGSYPGERGLSVLLAKHPDLPTKLPPLSAALKDGVGVSYTQWEAWLALYYDKPLFIARAAETAERGPNYEPTDDSRTAQAAHLARLKEIERYPGCTFTSADSLAKYVLGGGILDLLAKEAHAEPHLQVDPQFTAPSYDPRLDLVMIEPTDLICPIPLPRDQHADVSELITTEMSRRGLLGHAWRENALKPIHDRIEAAKRELAQITDPRKRSAQEFFRLLGSWLASETGYLKSLHEWQTNNARSVNFIFDFNNKGRAIAIRPKVYLSIEGNLSEFNYSIAVPLKFPTHPEYTQNPNIQTSSKQTREEVAWYPASTTQCGGTSVLPSNRREYFRKDNDGQSSSGLSYTARVSKLSHGDKITFHRIRVTFGYLPSHDINIRYRLHADNQPDDVNSSFVVTVVDK